MGKTVKRMITNSDTPNLDVPAFNFGKRTVIRPLPHSADSSELRSDMTAEQLINKLNEILNKSKNAEESGEGEEP